MSVAKNVLRTEGVIAGYTPELDILNGVDMEVNEGEIVTIVGPNGAGKSTLMKTVFGLLTPREGRVELEGSDVTGQAPHSITRLGVSYVAQLDNIFPSLTVRENLKFFGSLFGLRDLEKRIDAALEMFDMRPREDVFARDLSRGLQQRASLARAFLHDPDLLILDEPTRGIDVGTKQEIHRLLRRLAGQEKPQFG